jgi:hypothetical protein
MITDTQRRNQILRRINRIPIEQLEELDNYISKLEQIDVNTKKTKSYAGAWHDIDNSVFEDFTDNLIINRQKNRRRISE